MQGAKRVSKRLSKRLSRRSQKSEGGSDGPEIIDFRGVSVQLMVDTLKAVEDGTAASGVRVFVALVDVSPKVKAGAVIKLIGVKKNGKMTGAVAYVSGSVIFGAEQVRERPRSEWTTEDVAEHVVLAATFRAKCIYLDIIPDEDGVGQEYQGAFVSQARSCTFASLVEALATHYAAQGVDLSKQFVWLDLFSANQPLLTSPDTELPASVKLKREALLTNGLHVAIDKFDERLIFFDLWDDPAALGRAWCVWEIYGSISMGKPVQPVFAPGQDHAFLDVLLRKLGPDEITQTFADIDTRNAQCFKAEDKAMIDAAIESQLRDGFTTLNAAILGGLRDWLTEITHAAVAKAKVGLAEDDRRAQLDYARVLHQAGYFLNDQAKYEEALVHYEEALGIKKEALGEQHPSVAATLSCIASVYQDQGRYEEALAYFDEDLRITKEALGEQHPDVATTLNNIGQVYDAQGRYEEALAYFDEALVILKAKLGEQHPDVATTLCGIGSVYKAQGKYEEALAYYEEDLRITKEALGEQHPNVAATLSCIASVYEAQGRYEEALAYYDEALGIYKAKLGEQHPSVATTLNNIALVYEHQGRYEEALAYYNEALGIYKAKLGEQHPWVATTLSHLGSVYGKLGRHDEALVLLEQSLQIREEKLGERHGDVAKSLAYMAEVYSGQERFEEALDFFARALDIATEALPARNTLVPRILHGTAAVHKAQGDRAEALRLFRQALDLRKDLFGDAHPDTVATQAALDDLAKDE